MISLRWKKHSKAKHPEHEPVHRVTARHESVNIGESLHAVEAELKGEIENEERKISGMEFVMTQKDVMMDELDHRLKTIEDIVFKSGAEKSDSNEEISAKIETLISRADAMEDKIDDQKRLIEEKSKIPEVNSDINKIIASNADLSRIMLEKLKEFGDKVSFMSRRLELDELKMNFSETLNTLATTQNESRISTLVSDLRGYIVELKRNRLWSQNLEEVTESLLSEISDMWKSYGYPHLADLFAGEIQRLKSEM